MSISYNRVQKTFDLQNLKEHVTGKSLHNPYFENFERFYQKQTPDQANDGGREMRSLWTTVVGDLNAFNDFPKQVRYTKKIRDSGEGFMGGIDREACELTEGFLNFITVFEKIFGLTLEDFPDGKGFDSEKIWVKNALQTLFTTVNPSNTYDMDLANLKKTGSEISGTLPIIVTDRKTNQKLFSFDFYTEPHIHSDVKNLRFLGVGTPENYRYDLPDHRNTIHTRTAEDSLWLLIDRNKAIHHPLYTLFNKALVDNESRIRALMTFNRQYQDWMTLFPHSKEFLRKHLKNLLADISLTTNGEIEKVSSVIFSLKDKGDFSDVLFEKAKVLKFSAEYSDVGGKFKNLEFADFSGAKNFNDFSFQNYPSLKNLSLANNEFEKIEDFSLQNVPTLNRFSLENAHVKKLTLNTLIDLKSLNLTNTKKLVECALHNMPELENILTSGSQVEKLTLGELLKLRILSLSGLKNLKECSLYNMPKLENILTSGSQVEKLTLSELLKLRTLSLSGLKNLKECSLYNMPELENISLWNSPIEKLTLKKVAKLKNLELFEVERLDELSLHDMARLKKLSLKNSGVKKATLDTLSRLDEVDLSGTPNLEQAILKDLPNMKRFPLKQSSVQEVHLENMDALEELDFSKLSMLEHVIFKGSFQNLKKISFENSAIKSITGLENLTQLEELNIKGTSLKIKSHQFKVIEDDQA